MATPEYRRIAEAVFEKLRDERQAVLGYQFEMGKWLIASLLLLNGGALVTLGGNERLASSVGAAGPWFIGGIVAAMICGLSTWINSFLIVASYEAIISPNSLVAPEHWPKADDGLDLWIKLTFVGSIAAGVISLGLFVWGAISIVP